ncbi:MAG TPA: LysM peptidoglycan-binding domain-containing protein [Phototrophicaceae bacterium]|nr:LysM peptidoglycan-binding domain-containing protein [Phototrophicaceae bacterium]
MSALAIPVPSHPVRGPRAARPARHLRLVGPGFVPEPASVAAPAPAVRQPERPAMRLTARGRMVRSLVLLLASVVVAVAAGAWLSGVVSDAGTYSGPVAQVSVGAGDTVWAIASATAGEGRDVRDVVDDILRLNDLGSGNLVVGQQLVVPAG